MMRRWMWFLVGVVLAAGPMLAFADDYPVRRYWRHNNSGYTALANTWLQAVQFDDSNSSDFKICTPAPEPVYPATQVFSGAAYNFQTCPQSGIQMGHTVTWVSDCPYGGTLSGSQCVGAPACPTGQVRNATTGQCQVPPCTAGTEHSSGYYDYGTQYDGRMVAYGCANGCEVTFSGSFGGRQIIGGVYHYFMQGSYNQTGATCTAGPTVPTSAPSKPPISCGTNQSFGQINGKDVCIDKATGTTANPYAPKPPETETGETTTTQNPDGTTTTTTTKTDSSGRTTTTTKTCDQAGNCTEETTSSGGTGDGGGDTSGDPGTGAKDDPMEKENDQCKLTPNAAMCKEKVPIDEEGVPTDADTKGMTSQKNALDEKANELKAQLEGRSWERSDLGFSWNPGFPAGSCSGIEIANQNIDVCKPLGYVRDIWNYVCVFLAALAIWIRGTGALRGA